MSKKLTHDHYTVGWICPLEVEQIAALEMLDEEHERLPQASSDHNVYNLGSIARLNVVIAGLHQSGNNPAATVVTQMRMTFPNLRFGLLVGIGGGVPVKTDNGIIRLGDVVVSKPVGGHSGAVQYDHGKAKAGQFVRTGTLAPPPAVLLNAAQDLAAKRARSRKDPIEDNIKRVDISIRGLRKYKHPGAAQDHLYKPDYIHLRPGVSCNECGCDPSQRVQRPNNDEDDELYIVVHRGTIASGELVVKDAILRDQLAKEYRLLCFEMEAAGALADFPCIVIRGISDYCDSHKNDQWHGYAAAAAAAYARQLFFHMPIDEVKCYISETAERDIHYMKVQQDDQNRQKILDWLTPVDYGPQQSDHLRRRQRGTGQWLLDSAKYQTWLNIRKQALFCPGIPGAGKTILTSIIVDDLITRFQNNPSVNIAYIYCNFRRKDEQKIYDLLASLLKQLTLGRPSLPDSVKDLYDRHKDRRSRPSLDETLRSLHSVAAMYSRVFIIVDALDECQVSDNCRLRFLLEILNLQIKCGTNIFATSRFIPEITEKFNGSTLLEIRAHDEDVQKYLDGRISQSESKFLESYREEIKAKITKAVDGMFLLAQLHFDSIQTKRTLKKVKQALNSLPTGSQAYSYAYEDAMERIKAQDADSRELAEHVLSWIICAKRQLIITELQHALAVEVDEPELNQENFPQIEDMVSVCAGLVTVDKESNIIRLVHYTTQEYFERTQGKWFPNAMTNITAICITYLSYPIFDSGFCQTDAEFEERLRLNQLYDYAARNWGYHACKALTLCQQVVGFLESKLKTEAAGQALLAQRKHSDISGYSQLIPRPMTGLHLAAFFGLKEAMITLLKNGHDLFSKDSHGLTPLSHAAANGHEAVVELLLEKGAELETKSMIGRTPLSWAAGYGKDVVVKLLLEKGAELEAKDDFGRTPLSYAAESGFDKVVELLLEKGAKLETKDEQYSQTPLSYAAEQGHEEVVKLLLEKGAELETKSSHWSNGCQWPLSAAASNGYEAVVKLLLEKGAKLETKSEDGRTPLSYAAESGFDKVVELLLEKGAELETKDEQYSQTPLLYAAENGHEEVVKLLLEKGAELETKSSHWSNGCQWPLSVAASNGYEAVVKLLLEKGAKLETKSEDGQTPLSYAAEKGHEAVVELLLEKGAELETKDNICRTPLSRAAYYGREAVVKLLLEKGAELETKSEDGQTPLSYTAEKSHEAVVELLLEKGAELETKDNIGRTPLSWAASNGHEAMVEMLLEKGAELGTKDNIGRTPLSWAAYNGREAVVMLLLEKGAELDTKSNDGRTPLSWAAGYGEDVAMKLLLEKGALKGAELDTKSNDGRTPLSWAAGYGEDVVLELLARSQKTLDNDGHSPLSYFEEYGMESLLENGAKLETKDEDSMPLSYAASDRHEAVVKLLLEKGAELETKDEDGWTPLFWAASYGHEALVELLLEKGANLETKSKDGWTPLLWAASNGYKAVVELLLEKGTKLETEDNDGWTPLFWAALYGHEAVVELLLKKGAELGTKDNDGLTPLSIAASNGHEAVVKLLLEKGAKLETKSEDGQTPQSWAAENGHEAEKGKPAIVKIELDNGANVGAKFPGGKTAFGQAREGGYQDIVSILNRRPTANGRSLVTLSLIDRRVENDKQKQIQDAQQLKIMALEKEGEGKRKEAEILLRQAVDIYERVLGLEDTTTLITMDLYSKFLRNREEYNETENIYRKMLKGSEKLLGSEDEATITCMFNLATLLGYQKKYEEAEQLHRQTLHKMERVFGPNHEKTETNIKALAETLMKLNKMVEAANLLLRACIGKLELENPDVSKDIHHVVQLLREQGRYWQVEIMLKYALAQREERFGSGSSSARDVSKDLVRVLLDQKKYKEAEKIQRDSLFKVQDKVGKLGPDTKEDQWVLGAILALEGSYHAAEKTLVAGFNLKDNAFENETSTSRQTMIRLLATLILSETDWDNVDGKAVGVGNLYKSLGKLDEAEKMYQRTLKGKEKAGDPNHTSALDTVSNLGNLYADLDKLDEDEKMYQRALKGKEKALGSDSISTLDTVSNLGSLYAEQDELDELDEVEKMYHLALQEREKSWGPDHTSTLDAVNDLGNLYKSQGKLNEAEKMYQRALQGKEKAWGPDHASTIATVSNLGSLYADQGKLDEAEKIYQRALRGYEKAVSPELISTYIPALNTVENLATLYQALGRTDEAIEMYFRALHGFELALGDSSKRCKDIIAALAGMGLE